jgi:two-component system, chemotaxis family, CheB/CheR fusion protein
MAKKRKRDDATRDQPSRPSGSVASGPSPAETPATPDHAQTAPPDAAGTSAPRSAHETVPPDGGGSLGFPVVGIGASAGGLDAFKRFFSTMPDDSGAAFVLVPHLDPTHESMMAELLARQTRMPVCEAQEAMPIGPNHIYVIPPNRYLAIADGRLQLSTPTGRHGSPTAIDFFLRSLADEQRERAIGIILSGTSSHGTVGLKEIKLAGGMVMVQQPDSAEYDQMPRSAIATGLVDFVLTPEQMPEALVKYLRHPYVQGPIEQTAEAAVRGRLDRILALLKARTGYDFRSYRRNMLTRRVLRRMGLRQLERMDDYLNDLRNNPDEVTALYKDLLIGVTDFFRDPEAFQVLQQRVIPELLSARSRVRIWVPGCATGEEAYSIAMLFLERFTAEKDAADLQVFATDIDERALETARQGVYSESSLAGIAPERLQRFFSRIDAHHWQVNKQLRESITFAQQNLISDAPFSKLDLISCRNLLIYLEPELQAKVIRLFHFALADGGYLLLGPSEAIGREADLFEPVSRKWRVFRRTGTLRRNRVEIPIVATDEHRRHHPMLTEAAPARDTGLKELMQRLILEEFAPAAAMINHQSEIVSVLGPLVNYLEFPPGEISRDLLVMARPGLRTKLRAVIRKAIQTGESVTDRHARVKRDGAYVSCSITVRPVAKHQDAAGLLLVTFQDRGPAGDAAPARPDSPAVDEDESLLQQLEHELKATQEDLQCTIEEYESSTEELKASNEEVMSMNEELQSANEELETSKEELQSLNEELSTVNSQLQEKYEELEKSNSDLKNLMASNEIATLFLDPELRIKLFTPPAAKLLNLRPTDLDRPITDFAPSYEDDTLLDDCRNVLEQLVPIEREVWTRDESASPIRPTEAHSADSRCYLRRILPYRSGGNHVDGVVIALVDVTQRIADREALRRGHELNENIINTAHHIVLLLDAEGRILRFNRFMEQLTGWTLAEVQGRDWFKTFLPERDRQRIREVFQAALSGERVRAYVNPIVTRHGQEREIEWYDAPLTNADGELIGLLCTGQDVTERIQAERVLRERQARLLAILNTAADAIITIDRQGIIESFNPAAEQMFGYAADEVIGENLRILMPSPFREEHDGYLRRYQETGERRIICIGREVVARHKDGRIFPVDLAVSEVDHLGLFTGIVRDISERKFLQSQLLTIATEEQRRIGQDLHDGVAQELLALGISAEMLAEEIAQWDENEATRVASRQVRNLADGLQESLRQVRILAQGLVPVEIDAEGLTAALADLASRVDEQSGLDCSFAAGPSVQIHDNHAANQLYRIAQEAVANAVKHAGGRTIRISLDEDDRLITLRVVDDGIGIEQHRSQREAAGGGIGLRIMHYRAALIGAQLTVASEAVGGTAVTCVLNTQLLHASGTDRGAADDQQAENSPDRG